MSPEMLKIFIDSSNNSIGEFIPEKTDLYSLGLSFIRVVNLW